jgi:ubiquinol-cytochrome c reductase cytochrome b subunit
MIWISGMLLFVLFSAEAFSGYMLPWGQMSYWAGMVITNLFSGGSLEAYGFVEWIRGDYVPGQAFLGRFFMLHVLLIPLVIIGAIVFHFATLRLPHVNNQEGEEIDFEESARLWKEGTVESRKESKVIPFSPVFLSKDVFVMGVYFILFFYLVFYHFNFAMDPVNFDPADGLKTPAHIYPEWYFLWSYEILRPFSKDIGLIAFAVAQVALFALPFIDRSPNVAPAHKRGLFKYWFWILIIIMIALTALGKLPPTDPVFAAMGFVFAVAFLLMGPALFIITMFEKKIEEGA